MSGIRFFSFLSQLDPLTTKWFKGMNNAVPFEVKKIINDNLIKPCKSIIANKANGFYFPVINNTNDSWRNIAKNDHHGTIGGTGLRFESFWGFDNPNGTGWVDLHFNPNTQGNGRYTLNDAGISIYLFNSKNNKVTYPISAYDGANMATISENYHSVNQTANLTNGILPFTDGLRMAKRVSNTSVIYNNQNIVNTNTTITSSALPNHDFIVFKLNESTTTNIYQEGVSFIYNGVSLTDEEFTTLNNAVNNTLIQLLFYRFGKYNWGVKMAKSYFFDLHGFEKYEAWEVKEFISRHQSNYTPEIMVNSGAEGLTDWVDSNADGLADSWNLGSIGGSILTPSIVTGNGFAGNAQRVICTTKGTDVCYLTSPNITSIREYMTVKVSFKYRSNVIWRVHNGINQSSIPANTGNAQYYEFVYTVVAGIQYNFTTKFFYDNHNVGDWLEIDEISIKLQTGYLYNTFGVNGQNKQIADYIMMFKAGGNLVNNTWVKTGAILRINQDGYENINNSIPSFTKGTKLGILTITSEDGWNGLTNLAMAQTASSMNSYYGNFPNIFKLKTGGTVLSLNIRQNRFKIDLRGYNIAQLMLGIRGDVITPPGYIKVNLNDFKGGDTGNNTFYLQGSGYNPNSLITGDITLWTNEINTSTGGIYIRYSKSVIGSAENIIFRNQSVNIDFYGSGLTKGLRHWVNSLISVNFYSNNFSTSEIDAFLIWLDNWFAVNPPSVNLSLNLSGVGMGIPTGGLNNVNRLSIISKHVAQSLTATINVNS